MQYLSALLLLCSFALNAQNYAQHWATGHSTIGDNSDRFNDLLRDASGNLYAGGYTLTEGRGKDFLLIKFNSSGDTLWTRIWNGSGDGSDEIVALAFDNSGNIVAAGFARSTNNGRDFAVAKYNPTGTELWVRTYNHTDNMDDEAVDVACDANGNIVLTGYSYNIAGNADYLTVKYNSAGDLQWAERFDGLENLDDFPAALAVDASGNIFVTGRSYSTSSLDDYCTMKYTPSGVMDWLNVFDQTFNIDRARGIVCDSSGNVYVTGRSQIGNDDNFTTIKYNNSGSQLWLNNYDSNLGDAKGDVIAISPNGNYIAVSGRVENGTQEDLFTVVYTAAGVQQWGTPYFHTNNRNERVTGIQVSNTGEAVICGSVDLSTSLNEQTDQLLISYSATGVQNWVKTLPGTAGLNDAAAACVLASNGNVYMAGYRANNSTHRDATLTCYNTAGAQQFDVAYNGSGEFSEKGFRLLESNGAVYALGFVYNFPNDKDMCLIKYDQNGNKVWTQTWDGAAHDTDDSEALTSDALGNIYVAGRSKSALGDYDAVLLKYSANGTLVWSRIYDAGQFQNETLVSVATDAAGNVLACGYVDVNANYILEDLDWLIMKYDASGNQLWTQTKSGSGNDMAKAVTISSNGHATVTGRIWNGTDYDIVTAQFASSNGSQNWSATYDGTFGNDVPAGIATDGSGNFYVGGKSDRLAGAGEDEDFVMLKYNTAGAIQWTSYFSGTTNGKDEMNDVAADDAGNSYYVGESDGDATATQNKDYITVKLNPDGSAAWSRRHDSNAQLEDIAYGVAVGDSGKVFVTGQSNEGTSSARNNNIVTLIYDAAGNLLQKLSHDGSASLSDGGEDVIAGTDGAIYVTGFNRSAAATQRDFVTIRYATGVGIYELAVPAIAAFPVPASSADVLHLLHTSSANFSYEIYDVHGSLLARSTTASGLIPLQPLSLQSGIYFLRVKDAEQSIVKFIIQ